MVKYELFKNPPPEFRGVPFWSINDRLDLKEVARQIALIADGGYGGVFFHAREGLSTPFLGEEWFKAFESAVNEAKKCGIYMWIYDELRWPSGFAGGIIPALGSKYRAKALIMIIDDRAYSGGEVIATFKCKLNSDGLPHIYEVAKPGEEGNGYIYLSFINYVASPGEIWFNGLSYVDLLDQEVVRKFLDVAYDPYVKRFGDEIGKNIIGVFTDEPNITSSRPGIFSLRDSIPPRGSRFPMFAIPWTNDFTERFRDMNGYDIVGKLPELFFDIGSYTRTRYDFWRTITVLFLEAFSKQIYEWCERHGLKFTGHYLHEDDLLSQLICGGAVMPHYECQHIPGIDHLGMHVWGSLLTAKQVSSVANQLGKERVLCEAYGCTGNYLSFADRKWIGDWLYAMGVNLLNHHLIPYSMRGRRKRDYGFNFHWSQPWWKYNRILEDYFARLSYMLSRGRRVVNVLVIHPIGSAWTVFTPLKPSKVKEIDENFKELLRALLLAHVDFDLGDELLMMKYCRVKDGKLYIGRIAYDTVIIPPGVTLAESTVKLLQEFAEFGGKIIAVEPVPFLVDGERREAIKDLMSKALRIDKMNLATLVSALNNIPKPIVVEGDERGEVLHHLRWDESGALILFLANVSRENSYNLRLTLDGSFSVEFWDPMNGERKDYPSVINSGKTSLDVRLEPIGSALFVFKPCTCESKVLANELVKIYETSISGSWRIRRLNPNILVLDYCRYRINDAWSELMPVWYAHKFIVQNGLGTSFSVRFEFESEIDLKDRSLYLIVERPESFRIYVNNVKVESKASKFWLDWNFPMIDVSGLIVKGLNTIELEGIVDLEPELENVYLLGDFGVKVGVKGSSKIIDEPSSINLGDLCQLGYPFYAGEIELSKSVNLDVPEDVTVTLQLDGLSSSLAIVYVNDKEAGKALLPPYAVDVTGLLKSGENEIKILLVGNLRNALGPLHHKLGDPQYISPETFRDLTQWTDEYMLRPFGIRSVRILMFKRRI